MTDTPTQAVTTRVAASDTTVDKAGWWSAAGALLAAVAASACCVLPLVLLTLGVGGAWAGSLSALEPYRPIFAAITMALLAVGFYFAYRRPRDCGEGTVCGTPRSRRLARVGVWGASVLALALLAFPYVSPAIVGQGAAAGDEPPIADSGAHEQVILKVSGMTCAGCAANVQQALAAVEGVKGAQVTLDPPQAVVTYDPTAVKAEQLAAAVTDAGYPTVVASTPDAPAP